MFCLPTTHEGYKAAAGWFVASVIVGQFDANIADYKAKVAADPNYKANPFADKDFSTPKRSDEEVFADYCAKIRARRA